MQIWVDADACPNPIKDILFRVAKKREIDVTLVANRPLQTPRSPFIYTRVVTAGFDVADDFIAAEVQTGDLVITADIPLAASVIEKGCYALSPRGELFSKENIRERLNIRDFMDQLRGSGVVTGGPKSFSHRDRHAFANELDRFLARMV